LGVFFHVAIEESRVDPVNVDLLKLDASDAIII
jgi:hypothetical protein